MSFEARFPGWCELCDERIREDDLCVYVEDKLAHVFCPEPSVVVAEPCTQCWLVPATNGTCGCTE